MAEKFCQNPVTNAQNNVRIRRAEQDELEKEVKELRAENDTLAHDYKVALGKYTILEQGLKAFAEQDCTYGDNCPASGVRHGRCTGCAARAILLEVGNV